MDLSHSFTVPTSLDATWAHFQDIGALAECFPGAQVTSVGADDDGAPTFEGTCKVKLGPIALVYAGSGRFVERDEAGRRFVVDAKGRDKRGNGTAGATVTVTMAAAGTGEATQVDVVTDLAITGKPAQFGRGVMQDVSDKLLGQFVSCLEQRLAGEAAPAAAAGAAAGAGGPTDTAAAGTDPEPAAAVPTAPHADSSSNAPKPDQNAWGAAPRAAEDDALDLGSAVLPILVKTYGKQIAAVLAVVVGIALLRRCRHR
ncbi:SRPBCC family protein [Nocardioides daeguensis]|uniref:SRPBCC family protein n=1 Tax=Nocardioides daeguensis TaxID=908359 RepID=A0ABP6W739_9ACTN|nr:SRPBCC family protein [Nocardioides daeguensis]MBV6727775.1 SRPBCC family protein [Nocardioides daeguensis]MCR1775247.1 SRPBCC family protein [Nocardioides daeguensis]